MTRKKQRIPRGQTQELVNKYLAIDPNFSTREILQHVADDENLFPTFKTVAKYRSLYRKSINAKNRRNNGPQPPKKVLVPSNHRGTEDVVVFIRCVKVIGVDAAIEILDLLRK